MLFSEGIYFRLTLLMKQTFDLHVHASEYVLPIWRQFGEQTLNQTLQI